LSPRTASRMGPPWLPSRRNHVRSLWWPPALPAVATLLLLHEPPSTDMTD
jgi:hypothetical protein